MLEIFFLIEKIFLPHPTRDRPPAIVSYYQPPIQTKPIQIHTGKVVISTRLQQEIASQVPQIERQQAQNLRLLSIPIERTIGIGYLHQGYNDWKIKISYGYYSIDTTDTTIYSTQEIFQLKQAFALTTHLSISGKDYDTDGLMRQVGPMLHDLSAEL